ncbi:MAG: RNA methyltransferase [Clostridia bacterium]|nr:RNA methyltransferase [Clostridia bacterium]
MLPERFTQRMKALLGEEYTEFENALDEQNVRAIRVNTTKIQVSDFLKKTSLRLSPISYADDGFIPDDCDGIGKTAEHHAGMFYVQDPGAMATVKALNIEKGWRVLDACSAPGGKASQLASAIGNEGLILANEYVPKRAKIIVSNFERLGIKNAVVTSLDTAKIREMFDSYFDLVLCDAPCSGEGMFRKYDEAITEWSEENVKLCADRQREILNNLAPTVKAGGYLLYSTCTYSREENEDTVSAFLSEHPDFSLCQVNEKIKAATADGIDGMNATRRFYPHITKGEGQFIALMKKDENSGNMPTILYKENVKAPTKDEIAAVKKFISENISGEIEGRIIKWGEFLALIPHDLPIPPYSVFMPGVMLGEVKKGNFFPHHQFFSAYGNLFKRCEMLSRDDSRVEKYLRGEEIDSKTNENGWCAVIYEGVALGGGKISNGRVKNHYPKGLRNN